MIQDQLSDVLGELSRTPVVAYQIPNALERLCAQLTGMLPVSGCWAVVMDELGGELRFVAASDAVGRKIAALHVELGQLLADLTTASIVGAHRYQQVSGLAAGVQQRLADAAVLEQAKGRLSVQLGVQPDRALTYLQRYILAKGGSVREAAEQVTAGGLRLRRTADGTITRG